MLERQPRLRRQRKLVELSFADTDIHSQGVVHVSYMFYIHCGLILSQEKHITKQEHASFLVHFLSFVTARGSANDAL